MRLKAYLEAEGGRVQGAAVQALQHVRQQGIQQLRSSRSEGAQPAQPLLCKHVHTALIRHCSAVLTLLACSWKISSTSKSCEDVLPATDAGIASGKHAGLHINCSVHQNLLASQWL